MDALQDCTPTMYLKHSSAYSQIQKVPRNLARFRGIFMYARLDSNQRPSESELIKGTDVLVDVMQIRPI